jgi:hypothetical protein
MGHSYADIAARLGYGSRQEAHRAARRALAELAAVRNLGEMRAQMIEELSAVRRDAWQAVEHPQPLVDRVGRVVHDDDGEVVADEQARSAARRDILAADWPSR